ncbi:MAG: hypothetical protein WC378_09545 [Opitutaceae bacterium]|jgi:tetratricopeptide (TPR) repeat protein
MRHLIVILLLLFSSEVSAKDLSVSFKSIDDDLSKIAVHAQEFPPRFASVAERKQTETDLRRLLTILDAAVAQHPDDPEILFRDGFANAMGHNLDFTDCAPKCTKAFDRLLKLQPEDKRANYFYGAFLAATVRQKDSVRYLEKALALGMSDAHYTLAFVYISQGDRPKALLHLKEYIKVHPEDERARKMIKGIEPSRATTK